jgi:hypothetical protein
VSVLAGNGNGNFRVAGGIETGTRHTALATGDFNGDGITDVAMTGPLIFPARVSVFAGEPDGVDPGINIALPGHFSRNLVR